MSVLQMILPIFQLILTFGNICVLAYALVRFLNKPHDTLEEKVNQLETKLNQMETKLNEIEKFLHNDNERFKEQDETNEVLIHSALALIEYEIQRCLTESKPASKELEKARENLHNFLAKR